MTAFESGAVITVEKHEGEHMVHIRFVGMRGVLKLDANAARSLANALAQAADATDEDNLKERQ